MNNKYIELHTLEFDHKYSACGSCKLPECGYYYDECPNRPNKTIVTNAWNGKMVHSDSYTTEVDKITEEEFEKGIKGAYSHVGHRGIANRYNLRFNRKSISVIPGDEVYVVYIDGGILPSDGTVPYDVNLTFEHIIIKDKVVA